MTTTSETATLDVTRTFDAEPARVFDAWLSKSWGEWAGPQGVRGEVLVMEPHVGGRYRIRMHTPDGKSTLTVGGVYKEITRPSKLVMSWKWEQEETDTQVTLTFRAVGGKTELHLLHEGFSNQQRRDSHALGWGGTLDKLAKHLGNRAA